MTPVIVAVAFAVFVAIPILAGRALRTMSEAYEVAP
jgi:hypothetical protein